MPKRSMEMNPYAPPQADLTNDFRPEAERLRAEHINTEATIKSVGSLYFLGAFILVCLGLAGIASGTSGGNRGLTVGITFTGLGGLQAWVAYGLRRLRSWARIPTLLFSIIGLLAFPIGTMINAYIISQIVGKKAQYVMTPEYQEIIAATPYVKRKTPKAVWIILFILVGVLAVSIFMATRQG